MRELFLDIPRAHTALAEWSACLVYIFVMRKKLTGWKQWLMAAGMLAVQMIFLVATDDTPIWMWIPCMVIAVLFMLFFIYYSCDMRLVDSGYCTIKAFVLAEFIASFEWQLDYYFWPEKAAPTVIRILFMLVIYAGVCVLIAILEKKYLPTSGHLDLRQKELWSAIIIGIVIFSISNLSFVSIHTPFSGNYESDVMTIRTIVDLSGLAVLYAHYIQCCELRARSELEAMQSVLQGQYQQYQQSKESIDIINRKYHDFKHQIAYLRSETDAAKRNAYLDELESDIKTYEAQNKTGNSVLDTVLTSKSLYCAKHHIGFTCVADGRLLSFMDTMDICSLFGNALDNAIESEEAIADYEKRLIHLTLSAQKGFVLIKVENYFEGSLQFEENLPITTKTDKAFHGYGVKSMRYVAQKYNGTVTAGVSNQWFELKILIPMPKE